MAPPRGSTLNFANSTQGGEQFPIVFEGCTTPKEQKKQQQKRKKRKSVKQERPPEKVKPRSIGPIIQINDNDVLAGRGGRINSHPGNVQMRSMAEASRTDYFADTTPKLRKAFIGYEIVAKIRDMTPTGRWLKEDKDGTWWDVGDKAAVKKVEQAIREGKDGHDSTRQPPALAKSQCSSAPPIPPNNPVEYAVYPSWCPRFPVDDWYNLVQPPGLLPTRTGLGGYREIRNGAISPAAAERLKDNEMEDDESLVCMEKRFYATKEDIDVLDNLSDLTGVTLNSGMSGGSQLSTPSIMKGICTPEDDICSFRKETKSMVGQPLIPEDTPVETDSMDLFSYKSDHKSLDLFRRPDRYASSTSWKVSSTFGDTGDYASKRIVVDDTSVAKSISSLFSFSALSLDDITMRSQSLESNSHTPQYLNM